MHIIKDLGFLNKACGLFKQCISSSWFLVVMNEISKGYFLGGRGLRQSDPISSYLFIMVEEIFSCLLKKAFQDGKIGLFFHPRGTPLISYLLYANDIIIFAKGSKRSMRGITEVLETYRAWSAQSVSKDKSSIIFSKNVTPHRRHGILRITGFSEGNLIILGPLLSLVV